MRLITCLVVVLLLAACGKDSVYNPDEPTTTTSEVPQIKPLPDIFVDRGPGYADDKISKACDGPNLLYYPKYANDTAFAVSPNDPQCIK